MDFNLQLFNIEPFSLTLIGIVFLSLSLSLMIFNFINVALKRKDTYLNIFKYVIGPSLVITTIISLFTVNYFSSVAKKDILTNPESLYKITQIKLFLNDDQKAYIKLLKTDYVLYSQLDIVQSSKYKNELKTELENYLSDKVFTHLEYELFNNKLKELYRKIYKDREFNVKEESIASEKENKKILFK